MALAEAQDYAEQLYKALYEENDKDNRERKVKEIISKNNLQGRVNIKEYYNAVYAEKNLQEDLDSQLSSSFRDLVKELFMDPIELDCFEINEALNSFTYDKNNVFELITARPYKYRQRIKERYQKIYGKDLETEIRNKFSSDIGDNVISLLNTERDRETRPNPDKVEEKAKKLIKMEERDILERKGVFEDIFTKSSPEEFVFIGKKYFQACGKDLMEEIKHPLLKEIIYNSTLPAELYARKLNSAIKGFYTDSNSVNRIIASRCEVDMDKIKEYYNYIFNTPLEDDLTRETSGSYRDLLLDITNREVDKNNQDSTYLDASRLSKTTKISNKK